MVAKTSSGKLQRHEVRRQFCAGQFEPLYIDTVSPSALAPKTLAERLSTSGDATGEGRSDRSDQLTRAICEHLRDTLGLHDAPTGEGSLVGLGVDSLVAVQLQYELEEALGVALKPSALLRGGSISEIVRTALDGDQAAVVPADEGGPDGYELNTAQKALWFLQRAFPQSFAYNVTRAFRLEGDSNPDLVSAALDAVMCRHSSLRLNVVSQGGEPRVVVPDARDLRLEVPHAAAWSDRETTEWCREFATTPFDLERDALIRAALLRWDDHSVLVLALHHIVCDVASLTVIVADFAAEYARRVGSCDGAREAPADRGICWPAARERAVLAARGDDLAAFWREELAGEIDVLSLPCLGSDVTPVRRGRGAGASISFTATAEQTRRLADFARTSELTVHNLLLTAFQVLLHRLSGQPDIVVGVPTLSRSDRRLASWVGYLVNVVPIRSRYTAAMSFAQFAARTQHRMLDAIDHQDMPLSLITRLVNPDRDNAAASIFQAMFAYYTTSLPGGDAAAAVVLGDPAAQLPLGKCVMRPHPLPEFTAQSDVCLNVMAGRTTLAFDVQYDTDQVSHEQARLVETTFRTLLAAIANDPQAELRRLPVLTPEEVAQRVAASCGPVAARPRDYVDSFEEMVDRVPDAVAVDDGAVVMTYAEVDAAANHVATELRVDGV